MKGKPRAKLTWDQVRRMREEWETNLDINQEDLAKKYGIARITVCCILNHKTWKEEESH